MSREWKPGDVARMEAGGIVFRAGSEWVRSDGRGSIRPFLEPRPLVVIDPESIPVAKGSLAPSWLRNLAAELRADDRTDSTPIENVLLFLADEIEEACSSKPKEPTGLGAVVEDAEGQVYVRYDRGSLAPWIAATPADKDRPYRYYDDLTAVRVLSEGVSR